MEYKEGIILCKKYLPNFFNIINVNYSTFKKNNFDIKQAILKSNILLYHEGYFTYFEIKKYQTLLNKLVDKLQDILSFNSKVVKWINDFEELDEGDYLIDIMKEHDKFNPQLLIDLNDEIDENSAISDVQEFISDSLEKKEEKIEEICQEFLEKFKKYHHKIILNHDPNETIPQFHFLSLVLMTSILFWEYSLKLLEEDILDFHDILIKKLENECFPVNEIFNLLQDKSIEII